MLKTKDKISNEKATRQGRQITRCTLKTLNSICFDPLSSSLHHFKRAISWIHCLIAPDFDFEVSEQYCMFIYGFDRYLSFSVPNLASCRHVSAGRVVCLEFLRTL